MIQPASPDRARRTFHARISSRSDRSPATASWVITGDSLMGQLAVQIGGSAGAPTHWSMTQRDDRALGDSPDGEESASVLGACELVTTARDRCDLVYGPLRETSHEVGAIGDVAVDGAADHAGSGGDVAHAGVRVRPQHLKCDVEDSVPCVVHGARPGGFYLHNPIIAQQCVMK
jgi:hypothetical protein